MKIRIIPDKQNGFPAWCRIPGVPVFGLDQFHDLKDGNIVDIPDESAIWLCDHGYTEEVKENGISS
jgi:hypothetical protein